MSMDPELKKKWVEALRSGDYHQTKGLLRENEGFCCLGVLCDITKRGEWEDGDNEDRPGLKRFVLDGGYTSTMYLPTPLSREFGFNDSILDPLMGMNDEGESFSAIASYIEENL